MICYDNSVVFNNLSYFNSRRANVSQDVLVELYSQGKRLSLAVDVGTIEFKSPHVEVPVVCD
jgi:hypothetical protein